MGARAGLGSVSDLINVMQGKVKAGRRLLFPGQKRLRRSICCPAGANPRQGMRSHEGVGGGPGDPRNCAKKLMGSSADQSGPVFEAGATAGMRFADEAVIVANPEVLFG